MQPDYPNISTKCDQSSTISFTLSQTSPGFKCLHNESFENTVGEGAISPFSHSAFYPFGELSAIFIKFKIVICKLFQLGRV